MVPNFRWTVNLLKIQRHDRILEIGVGSGLAVELALREVPERFVAGVDHTAVTIQQAKKRNAAAVARGSQISAGWRALTALQYPW
jgi:precorrin-6B methylase 2